MLGGPVAIRHSLREGMAGVIARFGLAAAVAGATIGLVLVILDGVAARQLAQEWAAASSAEQDVALGLVHVNETINFALASAFNLVFAAATFILFGLAVAVSDIYQRWLGWVAATAGVMSLAAGTIQASVGEPSLGRRADGRVPDAHDHRADRHHAVAAGHGDLAPSDGARGPGASDRRPGEVGGVIGELVLSEDARSTAGVLLTIVAVE